MNQKKKRMKRKLLNFSLLLYLFCFGCSSRKEDNNAKDELFFADIVSGLNINLHDDSFNKIQNYYLEESSKGLDSIKDLQFNYAGRLFFKAKTIDSLYQMLPGIFWGESKYSMLDTTIYVNSVNIVSANSPISQNISNELIRHIKVLENLQLQIIKIRLEIEAQRPGSKNEKLDCQNCKTKISISGVENANTLASVYLETEKQFLIINRELNCSVFAIQLINTRKVASKNYKVRI